MSELKAAKIGRPVAADRYVKQALLKVAIRLLSKLGREGATARAICAEVGVGAPALYHHYGDLNGLHRAAIDETFRQVAMVYRRSAKRKGPLQGIRDGWNLFMHFAQEEPRMCRIVIQHIIAGDPPRAVAGTIRRVAKDLAGLESQGALTCDPAFGAQLLWAGALGAACFTAMERGQSKHADMDIQEGMLSAILASLLAKSDQRDRENTPVGNDPAV